MKTLPIGIQSFRNLRNNDCLYVDKTKTIHQILTRGKPYFLSRPRRFGKSLLISTIEEIFRGSRELFEGLYIYDQWDWTQTNPVVRLDFGGLGFDTPDKLQSSLFEFIDATAKTYSVNLVRTTLPTRFSELIEELHRSTGRQVVVLIDEYDKPIIDHLQNMPVANANRDILRSIYQVLKAADEHLRFIFLTGVSKFVRASIFSGLNNLNDITLDTKYASLCGYTQDELEKYFDGYIEQLASSTGMDRTATLKLIQYWYNGYSWDGATSVYNPFSTLLLFDNNAFSNYWFATGTPTFLMNIIRERNETNMFMQPVQVSASSFNSFEPETLDTIQLLFQTGYLTVKKIENNPFGGTPDYTLGIPNQEVQDSLLTHLFSGYSGYSLSLTDTMRDRLRRQLLSADQEGFVSSMQEMFAHIPYQLHISREAYYHSLLLLWLKLLGFEVQGEVSTDKGRIDAVWMWKMHAVIAELKYHPAEAGEQVPSSTIESMLDDAMSQIKERQYAQRYANYQITLAAIAFAGKEIACRIEKMNGIERG